MNSEPILLAAPDARWEQKFVVERERISAFVGDKLTGVEHIGSTAVSSLPAKPVVDILLGVPSLDASASLAKDLADLGYEEAPGGEGRRFFVRRVGGVRTFHAHVVELGAAEWRRHLAFRDALRTDPWLVARYQALKQQLARRFRNDRRAYTEGKSAFIADVLRQRLS